MIGFELKNSKGKVLAAVEEGVVSLIFTRVSNQEKNELSLTLGGSDKANSKNLTWISRNLDLGEEFSIKVANFNAPSKPVKSTDLKSNDILLQGKLRAYYGLKKELEEAGLI